MKISFDFDSTLSKTKVQNIAKRLMTENHEIVITTSRIKSYDNADLYSVADSLGITDITFTNAENKVEYLLRNNVDMHIDDDRFEIDLINKTKIIGVLVGDSFWIKKIFDGAK